MSAPNLLIAFQDVTTWGWWRNLCRPGFSHCFAVQPVYAEGPGWYLGALKSNASQDHGLKPIIFPVTMEQAAKDLIADGCTVVDASSLRNTSPKKLPSLALLWCVSCCKAIAGVRSARVLTPHGLYKWLLANGGVELEAGPRR